MQRNQRNVDGKVVMVVGLALAGFVAVTGFAMLDVGFGHVQWKTISDAHAVAKAPQPAAGVIAVAARKTAPKADEVWAADESAKGTRPDASH